MINLKENVEKLKFLNKFNTLILQKFKFSLPVLTLLGLTMFIFWLKNNQKAIGASCYLDDKSCTFMVREGEVELSAEPFPIKTEEMILFTLALEDDLQFESAWIQGVNMYMGRIPVLINDQAGSKTGRVILETFLGSCSEPNMRWQMILNLSDSDNQKVSRYINFSTTTSY